MNREQQQKLEEAEQLRKTKDLTDKPGATNILIQNTIPKSFFEELEEHFDNLKNDLAHSQSVTVEEVAEKLQFLKELSSYFETVNKLLDNSEKSKGLDQRNIQKLYDAIKLIKPQVKILRSEDVYATYKPANADESSNNESYWGFVNSAGKWFILRELGDKNKTWKYLVGQVNYEQGWQDRKKGDYSFYHEIEL